MTETPSTGSHSRRTPRYVRTSMAVGLAAVPAVGLALAGSTRAWQLAVLHVLLAATLLLISRHSDRTLAYGGRALQLGLALVPLVAAVAIGLLPLPMAVVRLVAPGIAAAHPDASWHTLSMSPAGTVSELAWWLLVVGYAVAVGVWGGRGRKAVKAENALFIGVLSFMAFAAVHLWTGADAILGVLPVKDPPSLFFAPFVNANFFGTVLLLAFPLALGEAIRARGEGGNAAMTPYAVLTVLLLCFMVALGSFSTLLALGVELLMLLWILDGVPRGTRSMVGLSGLAALGLAFVVMLYLQPDWWRMSVEPRALQWADAPRMLLDHWLAGTGGGAYAQAYPPYRSVIAYMHFTHMHMDPLEWLVETGIVGIAALLAAWLLFPKSAPGDRRRFWSIGLWGALASAMWNFPLQVPGIALCFAGVLAVRYACFDVSELVPARRVRGALIGLALLQLPAVAWQVRTEVTERAVATLERPETAPNDKARAARTLAWTSPGSGPLALHHVWEAERDGRTEQAVALALAIESSHAHDARTLRRAALVLWRADADDDALRLLDRAAIRDPNDFRTWVAISRIHTENVRGAEAATAFAEALRHWPDEQGDKGRPLDEAYRLLPLGEFWIEALADAPAYWSWQFADRMLDAGEPQLALQAIEQAARLEPEIYDDSAIWVYVLLANDRVAEAEAFGERLITDYPERPYNWKAAGAALEHQEQYDKASALYLRGFEKNRREPDLALRAVRAADRAGGPERALAVVKGIDVHIRHDPRIDLEAARLYLRAGRPGDCVLRLEDAGFVDPGHKQRAAALMARCGS